MKLQPYHDNFIARVIVDEEAKVKTEARREQAFAAFGALGEVLANANGANATKAIEVEIEAVPIDDGIADLQRRVERMGDNKEDSVYGVTKSELQERIEQLQARALRVGERVYVVRHRVCNLPADGEIRRVTFDVHAIVARIVER